MEHFEHFYVFYVTLPKHKALENTPLLFYERIMYSISLIQEVVPANIYDIFICLGAPMGFSFKENCRMLIR